MAPLLPCASSVRVPAAAIVAVALMQYDPGTNVRPPSAAPVVLHGLLHALIAVRRLVAST